MKTVLQQLIDSFDEYERESGEERIYIDKLKEVIINKFTLVEKQQIIEAWNSASGGDSYHIGDDYYKETFNI